MVWNWYVSEENPNQWYCVLEDGYKYIIYKVNTNYIPGERYIPFAVQDTTESHVMREFIPMSLSGAMKDCAIHYYNDNVKHDVIRTGIPIAEN